MTNQSDTELKQLLAEIAECLNEIRSTGPTVHASEFLTVSDASNYLKVSESLFRKWLLKNQIPFHRFGRCIRFNKTELSRWANTKMA